MGGGNRQSRNCGQNVWPWKPAGGDGGECRRCHNINNYRVWGMRIWACGSALTDERETAGNEFPGEFKGSDENQSEEKRVSQWTL